MLRLLQGLVYSGCLAFWVIAGLASLHFAWHSRKYFPTPVRGMFSVKLIILAQMAHLIWDVAFCGLFLVSIWQVSLIWKAVLAL